MSIVFINPYRYDPDAEDYINRVIAADVAAGSASGLEIGVQDAINAFVLGCKADGIWPAIKASCILAGARTLAGALVPLVSAAPTKLGTEAGWNYNRKTGLKANGTDNYLDSNRNNNADPQNSRHLAVYQTEPMTTDVCILTGSAFVTGRSTLVRISNISARISAGSGPAVPGAGVAGFLGGNRSGSASVAIRNGGVTTGGNDVSEVPASAPLGVFAAGNGSTPSNPRLAFYSIGESLDLALLDARITALINAIGAAIP